MRVAAMIVLFAGCGAFAQQDPSQPPPKPAQAPPGTDPASMATPDSAGARKPPQSTVDNSAYILGPEDQVSVFVFQGQEFTGTHMIRPDGKITVNLVGDVQ